MRVKGSGGLIVNLAHVIRGNMSLSFCIILRVLQTCEDFSMRKLEKSPESNIILYSMTTLQIIKIHEVCLYA